MSRTIEICHICEGEGAIRNDELTDYHKGEYDTWYTECYICKGSGRVYKEITIEYTPCNTPHIGRNSNNE